MLYVTWGADVIACGNRSAREKTGARDGVLGGPALKSWGDAVLAKEVRETVCAIAANRECVSGRNRPPERESTTA